MNHSYILALLQQYQVDGINADAVKRAMEISAIADDMLKLDWQDVDGMDAIQVRLIALAK